MRALARSPIKPAALTRAPARTILVLLGFLLVLGPTAPAGALPGDLDPSFDLDGKKTFGSGSGDSAEAVLMQADGKLLVAGAGAGAGAGSTDSRLAASRLNPDGSFDAGFGPGGTAGAGFGGNDSGYSAALQPDGKIVVAGETTVSVGTSTETDIAVARFNPDGSLDQTFDPGGTEGPGRAKFNYGGADSANAVLVQPDGKIVIAGGGGAASDFFVTRLSPDGSPDPSFGPNGRSGTDFGGMDSGEAAALQADGKIVVAGYTFPNAESAIARFKPDGSLDDTFAGDGKEVLGYPGDDRAYAVLVQPDRKIVVAGAAESDFFVTRLNPDGSPDPSFDGDGTSAVDFGRNEEGYAAALQANGKVVVAGFTDVDAPDKFAVARLQPGGALDTTFSFDGKTTLNFGGSDTAYAVALQPDGRIVVAGHSSFGRAAALARLEGDPPPTGGPGGDEPRGTPGGGLAAPRCAGRRATIVGTTGGDVLRGTRRADVIVALGGNDRVRAARGNDLVCGGAGGDTLAGGPGHDRLLGGVGNDRLSGGAGNDRLLGQPGRDRLAGGAGHDRCVGGSGRDLARCEAERSA